MPVQYMYGIIHWACTDCLVRPACSQLCNRTKYKHPLCEKCDNGCANFPCKRVLTAQMYEMVWENYKDQILVYFNETTLFSKLIKRPL